MHYNDKVRVKSGFYEGMEGLVIRENISMVAPYLTSTTHLTYSEKEISYKCKLKIEIEPGVLESDYIPESSLELIK